MVADAEAGVADAGGADEAVDGGVDAGVDGVAGAVRCPVGALRGVRVGVGVGVAAGVVAVADAVADAEAEPAPVATGVPAVEAVAVGAVEACAVAEPVAGAGPAAVVPGAVPAMVPAARPAVEPGVVSVDPWAALDAMPDAAPVAGRLGDAAGAVVAARGAWAAAWADFVRAVFDCAAVGAERTAGAGTGRVAAASVCEPVGPEPVAATPTQAPEPRTTTVRPAISRFRRPSRLGRACLRRPPPTGLAPTGWAERSTGERSAGEASTYAPEPSRSRPVGVRRITALWGAETAGERRAEPRVAGSRLSSMVGTVRGMGRYGVRPGPEGGPFSLSGDGRPGPWGGGALPGRLSEEHT